MMQTLCVALTLIYLIERLVKYACVLAFFRRQPPEGSWRPSKISVLQPILSGDPTLPQTLEQNLQLAANWPLEFIWLIDADDPSAKQTCRQLMRNHPSILIRLICMPRGGECQSPKMLKLQHGARLAEGDVIAVLDDDTVLPAEDLEECIACLNEPNAGLVFGLPYYVAFATWPSSFVSCFVNSNSLLTYIPYTYLTAPFTINGMFYMMRTRCLQDVGGFEGLEGILADDFAVARRFSSHGYRLVQSRLRHAICTHVATVRGYFHLLRRWLVFPRESIMRDLSWPDLILACTLALIPCLLPLIIMGLTILAPSSLSAGMLAACIAVNLGVFLHLNRRYLYGATPAAKAWLVPLLQFVVPIQLIFALLLPQRIRWRGHLIQVERGGTFRIVRHRAGSAPVMSDAGAFESNGAVADEC